MTHVLFHPKIFLICSTASIFRNRRAVRAEPDLVLRLPDHLQKRSAESFLFLPKSQTEITLFSSHLLWHYLLVSFKTFMSFLLVKAMTNGGPDGASNVFLSYMYQEAYTNSSYGYGMAIGVMVFLFSFALAGILNVATKRQEIEF